MSKIVRLGGAAEGRRKQELLDYVAQEFDSAVERSGCDPEDVALVVCLMGPTKGGGHVQGNKWWTSDGVSLSDVYISLDQMKLSIVEEVYG